jgi:hypothetical protein
VTRLPGKDKARDHDERATARPLKRLPSDISRASPTGRGALGLLGWRRKRKAQAI